MRSNAIRGSIDPLNMPFRSFRVKKTSHQSPTAVGIINRSVVAVLKIMSFPPEMPPPGMSSYTTTSRMPNAAKSPLKITVETRAQRHARNSPIPVASPSPRREESKPYYRGRNFPFLRFLPIGIRT